MKDSMTRRRVRILGIGLAVVALSAVAAFGVLQAITPAGAEQIALDQYPGATVSSTQLENEGGTSVYSVELTSASGDVEVNVDANSGTILAGEQDGSHDAKTSSADNDQIENEQDGDFDTED
jgi:hypothetical protein